MVGKREQTQSVNFFMVLTGLSTGPRSLIPTWERPSKLGIVNSCVLTSSWLGFYWCLYLITSRRQLPKRTLIVPVVVVGGRDTRFPSLSRMRTRISDIQFFLVIFEDNNSLSLAVRRLLYLIIYSFIQFIYSIFSEPFNYITVLQLIFGHLLW